MIAAIASDAPVTLEEARHQANVRAKADALYARGYRARWLTEDVLELTGGRGAYRLDLMARSCSCPHCEEFGYCSHLWGWPKLLADQEEADGDVAGREAADVRNG
jgi:hypothetical protein